MDNKVTIEKIVGKIIRKDFHIIDEKTTICLLTLDAVNKIWPLEAYLLQELLCQAG